MGDHHHPSPHDSFFKLQLEVKGKAASFIQGTFPGPILERLRLESLELSRSSFEEGRIGSFAADVVYECAFDDEQEMLITLLFEHKSCPGKIPHLQLLKYILGIWDERTKNGLPPREVLPVLFYHGQRAWKYKELGEYFEGGRIKPHLLPFTPVFDYIYIDLREKGDQWIRKHISHPGLRIGLLLMRNIGSSTLLEKLPEYLKGAEKLQESEEGRRELEEISVYLVRTSKVPEEKIRKVMDHVTYMNLPNPVGSTAWQIEMRVRSEGKAEGIAEGKAEVAKKMLEAGFTCDYICELTGLSPMQVRSLQKEKS